jgi:ABC-type sugar transport system ATPase subunit
MTVELCLEEIGKTFPAGVRALDQVTFTVAPGECLALMGRSGCGKTTLLRIIAGLDTATEGEMRIAGARINEVPSQRRGVAMLFQRPALAPSQTVRQNLRWAWSLREPFAWVRRLLGREPEREAELGRVAAMLDLEADLERPVQQLSGGQQQRVALGRCLLRQAKICLLDEPLGQLDAPLRADLRRQMRAALRAQGLTTIHVTHDPEEACAVGDRVAVMQAGRIVQIDTPVGLLHMPGSRFVAEVVHQPFGGLNVLAGEISREGMDTYFECTFGRWPVSALKIAALHEKLYQCENSSSNGGKVHVMLGIAARAVRSSSERCLDTELIQLTLPVLAQECTPGGTWIVAGDARGRWIGQSAGERFSLGQSVTMTFSTDQAYWFDHATGRTLAAPACGAADQQTTFSRGNVGK